MTKKTFTTLEELKIALEGKVYAVFQSMDAERINFAVYDKNEKAMDFWEIDGKFPFETNKNCPKEIWEDGKLIFSNQIPRRYENNQGYIDRIFMWENDHNFKITVVVKRNQLMTRKGPKGRPEHAPFTDAFFPETMEKKIKLQENFNMANGDYDWDEYDYIRPRLLPHAEVLMPEEMFVSSRLETYTLNIYKESGKAYIKKGRHHAFANYPTNQWRVPLCAHDIFNLVPSEFLNRINRFLLTKMDSYEQERLDKELTNNPVYRASALLFLSYYKGLQYFPVSKMSCRTQSKLGISRYATDKIKNARNKKEAVKFFLPNLTSKQIAKLDNTGDWENSTLNLTLQLFEDPNQIEKILKMNCYQVNVFENGTSKARIKEHKERISLCFDMAKLQKLYIKALFHHPDSNSYLAPYEVSSYFRDILAYFDAIHTYITPVQKERIMKCNGLKELHDDLSSLIHEIHDETYTEAIEYSEDDMQLEKEDERFSLRLAHSKKELSLVGKEMGICVGRLYAGRAFAKELAIAVVWAEKAPVLCIELNAALDSIHQVKTKWNGRLTEEQPELFNFFYSWVAEHELVARTHDMVTDGVAYIDVQQRQLQVAEQHQWYADVVRPFPVQAQPVIDMDYDAPNPVAPLAAVPAENMEQFLVRLLGEDNPIEEFRARILGEDNPFEEEIAD